MSIPSLRNKQIAEVLDVYRDINRQVFNRERKQVAGYIEGVAPKSQRDLEAEVGVDKVLEQLDKIINQKILNLEVIMTRKGVIGVAEGFKSYAEVVNNADLLVYWNSLARIYTKGGISRQSQELIKVKLQSIKGGIDALVYGTKELLNFTYDENLISKTTFEVIKSYALYSQIKLQLENFSIRPIEQGDIEASYKNYISTLPEMTRSTLERNSSLSDVSKMSIRGKLKQYPLFSANDAPSRIREIEQELGIRVLPQSNAYTGLPEDFQRNLDIIRATIDDDELKEAFVLFDDLQAGMDRNFREHARIVKDIEKTMKNLEKEQTAYFGAIEEGEAYRGDNQRVIADKAKKVEKYAEKFQELRIRLEELTVEKEQIEEVYNQARQEADEVYQNIMSIAEGVGISYDVEPKNKSRPELGVRKGVVEANPRVRVVVDVDEEDKKGEELDGNGRGLATMKDKYFEEHLSSSDSESDEEEKFVPYKPSVSYSSARNDFYRINKGK